MVVTELPFAKIAATGDKMIHLVYGLVACVDTSALTALENAAFENFEALRHEGRALTLSTGAAVPALHASRFSWSTFTHAWSRWA